MSDKVEDVLKSKQIDYDIKTEMSPEELKGVVDQYDGILIRSATKLTKDILADCKNCLLYTSPSPRDCDRSRMPSSA